MFTRKAAGNGYLISTNFNLANPENGTKGWRYDKAVSMLEGLISMQNFLLEYIGEILDAVHLETLTSYTLYSNIFDLRNRKIYLYYLSQYDELVELDLDEEISKGQRVVEMRDLFTSNTVDAGQVSYRWFELRFKIAIIVVVAAILVLMAGVAVFIVKKLRGPRRNMNVKC